MPIYDQILREKTHKGDVEEIEKRVFYTLTDQKGLEGHFTAKALSILISLLHEKGALNDKDIDKLLFETIQG